MELPPSRSFVLRSVQFQHTLVNCPLIGCIHSKQCRSNDRFHCIYGLVDTQAVKLVYIIVPEDKCLVGSYRGSGGRGAPAHAAVLRKHVHLQHGSRFCSPVPDGRKFSELQYSSSFLLFLLWNGYIHNIQITQVGAGITGHDYAARSGERLKAGMPPAERRRCPRRLSPYPLGCRNR